MNQQMDSSTIDPDMIRTLRAAGDQSVPDLSNEQKILQRRAWTLKLLSQTLHMCEAYVPHYRDAWRERGLRAVDLQSFEDLQRFPVTRKADAVADITRFLNEMEPRTEMRDTSGTTGRRLTVYGNLAEHEAVNALKQGKGTSKETSGIVRILPPMKRAIAAPGLTRRGASRQMVCFVTAYEKARFDSYDNILDVLFQDYGPLEGGGFSVLHVTPPFMMENVMDALDARGADMRRSPIETVMLTGNFVFSDLRERIQRDWNARVLTSFSCTEVTGEARECLHRPNVFHVGATMHAEVLDPRTLAPVGPGEQGLLALTSLSPFQTVTPFIRYLTGDLVRYIGFGCSCGNPGFTLSVSGRFDQCCDLASAVGERNWIGPFEVGEALCREKVTAQMPFRRFRAVAEAASLTSVGRIIIHVESAHPGAFDPDAVAGRVSARLAEVVPSLTPHLARGLIVETRFHQRGALADHWAFYPNR